MKKNELMIGALALVTGLSLMAACGKKPAETTAAPETTAAETTAAETTAAPETAEAESSEAAETAAPESTAESKAAPAAPADPGRIRLGGLKGPTSIGMVKLLSDSEKGETALEYTFNLAGAADELTPLFLRGELDAIAVPANLASVLYNKTSGGVEIAAVNTLGVLYLVENGAEQTVNGWEDLRGKTIFSTGKGTTPEYVLRYLLTENGLDPDKDVTIEWKSEPSETVGAMAASKEQTYAVLPQPYVTAAKGKLPDLHVSMSLTEEWDKLDNGSRLVTAGLIIRRDYAEKYPDSVNKFLAEYAASTEYVNQNVKEAAELTEHFDIIAAAVAEKAIPDCNIVCLTDDDMKAAVSGYLTVLFGQNPEAVGGKLPGSDFYYYTGE